LEHAQDVRGACVGFLLRCYSEPNTAVKIVGRTADPASALKMASKVLVDETAVRQLRIGEFFVRVGNAPTCKLQIPDTLLRAENRLGPGEWQRFLARQGHSPAPPLRRPQEGAEAMRAENVSPRPANAAHGSSWRR
jgi:hypothetical protein